MFETRTAQQILDAMVDAYANCRSFRATGVDTLRRITSDGRVTVDKETWFTLAFSRPDRFRYEAWNQPRLAIAPEQFLVWSEGDEVRCWWSYRPERELAGSLELALAGATGACGYSALITPVLLLKERLAVRTLADLVALKRGADEELDGVRCFRVEGCHPEEPEIEARPAAERPREPIHLWIEPSTSLLRRFERRFTHSRYDHEFRTDYRPEVNVPLADPEFRWDPHPARRG